MTTLLPVMIAGVSHQQTDFENSLHELAQLAATQNYQVVAIERQMLPQVNRQTYFGTGKIKSLQAQAQATGAKLILINDELTPTQLRNLENATQYRLLDRTELILQIFAQQAHTRPAQLQVRLAQLKYQLPRIHPSNNPLDQQRGGSGFNNRGAGESQRELNKRQLRQKIQQYQKELRQLQQTFATQSQKRQQADILRVALVGYTNAGKSSTLNALLKCTPEQTAKEVLVEDQLFATLDTAVREIKVPNYPAFLISDTVGFIDKLPTLLVESFRSTLEEARQADLLVQVIDGTNPDPEAIIQTTNKILAQLEITDKPMIYAYNKADLQTAKPTNSPIGTTISYSAHNLTSVQKLLSLILQQLFASYRPLTLLVPFTEGPLINQILCNEIIRDQSYTESGIKFHLFANPKSYNKLQQWQSNL
ncbi:GTPase HflX [Lactobacillus sp. DCY120]|uniref:GTPase HflX n=1 Tax=Bombilactobacillus apium TaxID=2675299 RepID=A0A850R1Z4_9LACO|nr:GTPase HflX [Bombilactobacillus apium]NVY97149.1 GTPase HflX [Bombilactobacillus apium]